MHKNKDENGYRFALRGVTFGEREIEREREGERERERDKERKRGIERERERERESIPRYIPLCEVKRAN